MGVRRMGVILVGALFFLGIGINSFAQEITLVLVGQTHAMVYHCHCPIEPDGGIARRATLIQQLRKANPNLLLLDSGSFFAGGQMDQESAGEDLDKARSLVHLKAMELMKYDAAVPGPDEFNFGKDFLDKAITGTKIPFLAANISSLKTVPFILKKFGNTRVGLIGLVNPPAGAGGQGLVFSDPQEALKNAVSGLKKQNADIIVLSSGLDEQMNRQLLQANPEINILIEGSKFARENVSANQGVVLLLAPRWEGRRLVAVTFSLNKKALEVKKVEDLRVSDKIADDKQMLSILPQCYSARNCVQEGMVSSCANPGRADAACQYKEAASVGLTIVNNKDCRTCDTSGIINSMKRDIPGLKVTELDLNGDKAQKLISDLGLKYLPAYLLDKSVEKEPVFGKIKDGLELRGGYYFLNPRAAGFGFFLNRPKAAGRLDVFLSIFAKDSGNLLDTLKEFTPEVHFLTQEDDSGEFVSPGGKLETEEDLRSVCVKKYYPGLFYNYITCRSKSSDSSWWEDCLQDADLSPVSACARGPEGKALLKENISLNRELEIAGGPTYVLDNDEIFSSVNVPQKEEFRKILFKR